MNEVLESLQNYLSENWPELIWIAIAAGGVSYLSSRKSRLRWMNRDFLDRLNVSLTSIEGGTLRIRTVFEMDCVDIFLNATAAKTIVQLAKKTSQDDSIIPIPQEDTWQYLNAVLNEVSERFAEGQIRRDMGLPVEREEYLLSLTCEKDGPVRTQKIRGLLVRKSLLTQLPKQQPNLESPLHITRWTTLKQLANSYKKQPHQFIELEICM